MSTITPTGTVPVRAVPSNGRIPEEGPALKRSIGLWMATALVRRSMPPTATSS